MTKIFIIFIIIHKGNAELNNQNSYLERYLSDDSDENSKQSFDNFGFLAGKMKYENNEITWPLDSYYTFEKIINNKFSFIVGEGGLGKSTFLFQVEEQLKSKDILCIRINLRDLSKEALLTEKLRRFASNILLKGHIN